MLEGDNLYLDIHDFGNKESLPRGRFMSDRSRQNRTTKEAGTVWRNSSNSVCLAREGGVYDILSPFKKENVRCDTYWLRDLIWEKRPLELPFFNNSEVFKSIVKQFIEEDWKKPCQNFIDAVFELLIETIDAGVNSNMQCSTALDGELHALRFPKLRDFIVRSLQQVAKSCVSDALSELGVFIRREQNHPYTQNDDLSLKLATLRSGRLEESLRAALGLTENMDPEKTIDLSILDNVVSGVFASTNKKTIYDQMAEDMEYFLDSYGKIAENRFVDNVPMICEGIFRKFLSEMETKLFGITDRELENYVSDTPEFENNICALRQKLEDLQKGLEILDEFSSFP